jgi:hypothetical protein
MRRGGEPQSKPLRLRPARTVEEEQELLKYLGFLRYYRP